MFAYFQYLLIRALSLVINFLPEDFALQIGKLLGKLTFYLDSNHRKVALKNLTIAFGEEKSKEEIFSIAKRTFQNMGMTAVEFFRIPKMDQRVFKEKITIRGMGNVKDIIENRKNGVLLLLSHFGNWELMGVLPKFLGLPISVVVRPIKKNRWLDGMVLKIRKSCGIEIIDKEKASKDILRSLSENRFVGILIDQRAKRSECVWVNFFGKKAPTTPALAVLGMRTGAPVVPVFMVRNGFKKHTLFVEKPVSFVHTGDIKKDVIVNTQIINDTLERMIRLYPDQWFWVHRRWERKAKERPNFKKFLNCF